MQKKSYVDSEHGQIHLYEFGEGPAIVMNHQAPTDSRQFFRAAPIIADAGFRVILVDSPGYGMSDAPPMPPGIKDYAGATVAAVEALQLDAVLLVGHHTGSAISTEAALVLNTRVAGVVLHGPLLATVEERKLWHENLMGFEKNWAVQKDASHFESMWNFLASYSEEIQDLEAWDWMVGAAVKSGTKLWYAHNAAFLYDHEIGLKSLRDLKVPVLVLNNTGDSLYEISLRAKRSFPEFDYGELAGGSFEFANEQPRTWAQAIVEYAKKIYSS